MGTILSLNTCIVLTLIFVDAFWLSSYLQVKLTTEQFDRYYNVGWRYIKWSFFITFGYLFYVSMGFNYG